MAAGPRRVTILNVDDPAPGLYSRSRILRQAGFDVCEATTGAEALRLTAAETPDLVLLDAGEDGDSAFGGSGRSAPSAEAGPRPSRSRGASPRTIARGRWPPGSRRT